MPLGSFKLRVAAIAIDFVLVYHFFIGLITNLFVDSAFFNSSRTELVVSLFLSLLFPIYKIIAEWKYGTTLGKKIVGLKVVDTEFNPISFKASLIRNAYLILYFVVPGIFLLIFYDVFFKHSSGGEYVEIIFTGIERLFKAIFVLVIYLVYNLAWGLLIFLTSMTVADSAKKQTLFDKISQTLSVTSKQY